LRIWLIGWNLLVFIPAQSKLEELRALGTGGRKSQRCSHEVTLSIQTSGLEHVVCERCGEVNVRYLSELSGSVDRSRFARDADRPPRHLADPDDELDDDGAETVSPPENSPPIVRSRVGWPVTTRWD
jgi:hypothetical protein